MNRNRLNTEDAEFINSINQELFELWCNTEEKFENYNKNFKKKIYDKLGKENDLEDEIKEKVIETFRTPAYIHDLPKECKILFIGLNPSFSETGIVSLVNDKKPEYLIEDGKYSDAKAKELFEFNSDNNNINTVKEYERLAHGSYAYFKKFDQLAYDYLNLTAKDRVQALESFMHIDLFFIRETKASKIEHYLKSSELKFFFKRQLLITDKIIKRLNPDIILVANACASKIFKEIYLSSIRKVSKKVDAETKEAQEIIDNLEFLKIDKKKINKLQGKENISLDYNERLSLWLFRIANNDIFFKKEFGTYFAKIDGKESVIFFSGMLSGQRALDLDTYRRLRWHILSIKEKLS